MAGALYAMTHQPMMLMFGLMSPVMLFSSSYSDKRFGKKQFRNELKEYREKRDEVLREVEQLRLADQRQRRDAALDPASSLLVATGPRRRLWERRQDDGDAL